MFAEASLAAFTDSSAPVDIRPMLSAAPDFVGGVRLRDSKAASYPQKPIVLERIAEYRHLFAGMDTNGAVGVRSDRRRARLLRAYSIRWQSRSAAFRCPSGGCASCRAYPSVRLPVLAQETARSLRASPAKPMERRCERRCGSSTRSSTTPCAIAATGRSTESSTIGRRPAEILTRVSGDCEDFAILKMTGMIRAGIPANSLSIVVLRDNGRGVFHAVLAVTIERRAASFSTMRGQESRWTQTCRTTSPRTR